MPERVNFTKGTIRDLLPPDSGRRYVYDTKVPNLCLCVTASGAKTYYRNGRVDGKPTRIRIGRVEDVTPEQAREECLRLSGEIASRKNPHAERLAKRQERTLRDLFEWVLEHHSKPTKRTWRRDEREFELYLSHWSGRRLGDLTTAEVREHHTRLRNERGPYAANKMRELLRLMYRIAIDNGWAATNPCRGVKRFTTESRERFLTTDELARFFAAVHGLRRETSRDCILMALYTGGRRSNVLSMRWDELDLDAGLWTIPAAKFKTKKPVVVVLVDQAVAILRRRQAASESPWVFPGQGKSGHMVEPKAAWEKVIETSGIQDLRLHDLRRTLGSWQAGLGASLPVIGKSLGHRSHTATQVYARLHLEAVRASVTAAVNAIEQAAQTPPKKS